jgi:hypothetical protein
MRVYTLKLRSSLSMSVPNGIQTCANAQSALQSSNLFIYIYIYVCVCVCVCAYTDVSGGIVNI